MWIGTMKVLNPETYNNQKKIQDIPKFYFYAY